MARQIGMPMKESLKKRQELKKKKKKTQKTVMSQKPKDYNSSRW